MIRLLLLFGGQSSEHTVSRSSAASLIPNIDKNRLDTTVVGITREGRWYLTKATPQEIADGSWEQHPENLPAFLSPNRAMPGLQVIREGKIHAIPLDVVFPVMHGELCEDGALQGLFELCGLPYVGPGICASACSMDKAVTKQVAAASGVRQARYYLVTKLGYREDVEKELDRVEDAFAGEYPLFVKPASAGSSVGVSKAHDRQALHQAILTALKVCPKVLIEETIIGREVEVAVMGNADPKASVVGEVLAANEFYDFNAKYENNASRTVIPADISEEASDKLRSAALKVYQALGCTGMSRVDFFLQEDGDIVFNEINTLPGFTKISMYPMLWAATGIPYSDLLVKLCETAIEKGCYIPL